MEFVPAASVLQPAVIGMFWIHLRDSIVDRDKHRYGEDDGDRPERGC